MTSLSDLMRLLNVQGSAELQDLFDDQTEGDAWIDSSGTDKVLTLCVGDRGISLAYPFTLAQLWQTLDEADQLYLRSIDETDQ